MLVSRSASLARLAARAQPFPTTVLRFHRATGPDFQDLARRLADAWSRGPLQRAGDVAAVLGEDALDGTGREGSLITAAKKLYAAEGAVGDGAGRALERDESRALAQLCLELAAADDANTEAQYLLGTLHYNTAAQQGAEEAQEPPAEGDPKAVVREIRRLLRVRRCRWASFPAPPAAPHRVCARTQQNRKARRRGEPSAAARALAESGERERSARQQAEQWLTKAASGGHVPAMVKLGNLFMHGTEPQAAVALRWYRRAASADHPDALYNAATLLFEGTHVAADKPAALRLFQRASQLGDASASYFLGYLHHVGDEDAGVAPAPRAGARYLAAAADAGHADAAYYLAQVREARMGAAACGCGRFNSRLSAAVSKWRRRG